jgi:hypothetical protein
VETISSLHTSARDELLALLAETGPGIDPGITRHLRLQADVLASLAEGGDRYKARFLGLAISFGVLRTAVVTAATLGIGVWSILRNFGVAVTAESFCSTR